MDIDKIKETFRTKTYIKYILVGFLMLLMILYLKTFFTKGIYFNNTFLKKDEIASERHYIGRGIHITAKGKRDVHKDSEVIFRLSGSFNTNYTVNFKNANNWRDGIEKIADKDGNVVFEGSYMEGSPFLFNQNGVPIFDEYHEGLPLIVVAETAYGSNEVIRGNSALLFSAIFILIITFIDFKYPLLFFTLKYYMSVDDPQPSEYYIATQRASWIILLTVAIILLIMAI